MCRTLGGTCPYRRPQAKPREAIARSKAFLRLLPCSDTTARLLRGRRSYLFNDGGAFRALMRGLNVPHGSSGRVASIANARNQTAPYHVAHAMRSRLDGDADSHDDGKEQEHSFASEFLSNHKREESASKAAEIVDRDNESLHSRRRVMEVLQKVLSNDDTTEDALFL